MATDSRNGAHPASDGIADAELRPYSAPHLIRLDTRATAFGLGAGSDGLLSTLAS